MNPSTPTTVALPAAPINASPVPWLTSIHSAQGRGNYGSSAYRGNCGGHLIRDLLQYFRPRTVFDPMTGSGTCKDVCRELHIPCVSADIRQGFDAAEPSHYPQDAAFDFVWMHPPYWRQIVYSQDPRDLSTAPTAADFYVRFRQVMRNCKAVLAPGGKIAVLIGDYYDLQQRRMVPLVHMTKDIALNEGMWPACTDIIRFQHGNTSSRKTYRSSFIPGLHDVCMVFQFPNS